jgi:hypothetical protein
MNRNIWQNLAALLLAPLAALQAADTALSKPVRIESGRVQGVPNQGNGVVAFKGIPYAAA